MHRFWIFPLILAIVIACLPAFVVAESIIPIAQSNANSTLYPPSLTSTYLLREVGDVWKLTAPYGTGLGVAMGLGMALFDWFRNGYRSHSIEGSASRLISNLWWCGLYASAIITLDSFLFWLIFKSIHVPYEWYAVRLFPLLLATLLSLSAVLWATIRTITSPDVLSPRVLGTKLKRSAYIENPL